jgi:membrane protease YdiL (CAAX protease family)
LGWFLRPDKAQIQSLLVFFPRGLVEMTLWAAMSLSAALCEEFVYRGYLQTRIRRLSGSIGAAVVVQALAYSVAHAALPWKIMVTVAFLGILFGTRRMARYPRAWDADARRFRSARRLRPETGLTDPGRTRLARTSRRI